MPSIASLKEELNDVVTLKFISSAFTEASAARLRNIKASFEKNRAFYEEVSHVYNLVQLSAEEDPKHNGNGKEKKPEKNLSVALTSNQRFYGSLNINIMHTFLAETEKNPTDIMIIGVTGHDYMKASERPYKKLEFAKDLPTTDEIRDFLERAKEYRHIYLYYPKFVTLLTQTVGITDITHMAEPGKTIPEEELHILFEPEFHQILEFFRHQVRSLLFLRVIMETDLSRTAARLLSMSAAEERSDVLIKAKKSELRKVVTSFVNAQLLETFAGMTKWGK